jgi:hypothetical protein
MELTQVERDRIDDLRAERQRDTTMSLVPGFYSRLREEAAAHLIQESIGAGGPPRDLGYALAVERPHAGHTHMTVVELHLSSAHQSRYEDVLDLLRERLRPTAYLVRTDDCRLNATLLARGLQVEAAALVMLPQEAVETPAEAATPVAREPLSPVLAAPGASGVPPSPEEAALVPFGPEHLPDLQVLLEAHEAEHDLAGGHVHAPASHSHAATDPPSILAGLESLAREGGNWALLKAGRPVAVIARLDGGDGRHELLDLALALTDEDSLAWALARCTAALRRGGRRPAAVIDAGEPARRRIFRKAGYYSAAAYMVFYDPEAGRPSVGTMTLQDLQALLDGREQFRLVDVLGETHWRAGHLPGSEWVDFKGLAREARRRFKPDELLVLYCDGFT